MMLLRWFFTVFSLISSAAAISLLTAPRVSSSRTSRSRGLSLADGFPCCEGRTCRVNSSRVLAAPEGGATPGHRWRDDRSPADDPPERAEELFRRHVLEEVAMRPRLERVEELLVF